MKLGRLHLIVAASMPLLLQACGGDPTQGTAAPATSGTDVKFSEAGAGPGTPASTSTAVSGPAMALSLLVSSAPAEGPPRLDPNGIPASQVEASLARYENAAQDETSCWTKEEPCDGDYAVELNRKSHGLVGWWTKTGRDLFVDAEDVLRIPPVAGPVTVFVRNNATSKDAIEVTLEDRSGTRLHALPSIPVGAYGAVSWTRTDDRHAGPYRLRLSARKGPGEHTVNYTVLPISHAHWLALARATQAR